MSLRPDPGRVRATRTAERRAIRAWCLYDFANSSFTTLVVTFIYATWFSKVMAPDEIIGTQRWSWGITASSLCVALVAPLMGALADRHAWRRPFFVATTLLTIGGTVVLYGIPAPYWLAALVVFVITNTFYELAGSLYNSFLPGLGEDARKGRISGAAWGLGYAGGLLCLVVGLGMIKSGLDARTTNLLVAAWFLVFSLPALLLVPEPASPNPERGGPLETLAASLRHARSYPQALKLLVARLIYNDGIVTIFAFGGIYAAGQFGMSFDGPPFDNILVFGIALNVAAGLGAWAFGILDDRLGGKRVVLVSLIGLVVATVVASLAPNRGWFWAAGMLIGLLVGPNQSASRSLMARLVPRRQTSEFFGLYAFSGKLTSFFGPLLLGWLTSVFESQRAGVASVIAFFVVGGAVLLTLDEADGRRQAIGR